jgi:anti-anti-sigma factor
MLSISSAKMQDSLVVTLEGRIDANSAKELEHACLEWIAAGEKRFILDLSAVNFISSAGLRVILLAAKRVEPLQGSIKLCGLSPTLRDVFEISGFSKLFTITQTVNEAL